jgi:hypothetical protein
MSSSGSMKAMRSRCDSSQPIFMPSPASRPLK